MASEVDPSRPLLAEGDAQSLSTRKLSSTTAHMKFAVASFSLVGIGCSAGYYLAPAGFFEHRFESNTFFLWMLIALFLPYPVILMLQEKLDAHLDSILGTRQTYFFRVIAVQILLAFAFVGYSLSCQSAAVVLAWGVVIGTLTAVALASTMQLMAAWDPDSVAWASVGKDLAGGLPVFSYLALHFSPSSASTLEFQYMQLFPITLICLTSMCLVALHFSGIWDKAYDRLGYDLWNVEYGEKARRQRSESDMSLAGQEVDSTGLPIWTPKWQFIAGFNCFLSFMLLPLVTFRRDPDLTQKLILLKLAMDCAGRCVAACLVKTGVLGLTSPRHYLLGFQVGVRAVLFGPLLAFLAGHFVMPSNLFAFLWSVYYFVGTFAASQVDVTIVRFAPVALRKSVTLRCQLFNFLGLAVSLGIDVVLILM